MSITTPRVFTATAAYNVYGDPLTVTDTLGYTTTFRYDADRNLKAVTDTLGYATTFNYNLDNELTRVTRPDTTHSDYGYDGDGRVITQSNGLGQTTQYAYDSFSRLSSATDPLGRVTRYDYDLASRPTVMTDANGYRTTYAYDKLDQLRTITYTDGTTPNVAFDYNSLGMRTAMTDGIGSSLYSYDSLNRLVSSHDGLDRTVGYHYDLAGRLTSLDYPSGSGGGARTVTRQYNAANRLTDVTDWLTNTTHFAYDLDGNLHYIQYPTGVESVLTHDAAGQLLGIEDTSYGSPFLTLLYQRNRVGALTSSDETEPSAHNTHGYTYDSFYRLTGDQLGGGSSISSTWAYDAATQIFKTHYTPSGGSDTEGNRTYDKANELLTLVEKVGTQTTRDLSFSYDKNGNRTQTKDNLPGGQTTTYKYDQANRLVEFNGSTYSTYSYNGDGLRMRKVGIATSYKYTWDMASTDLPLLLDDGVAAYIYGPGGMVMEEVTGDQPYYYHPDQLGSIRAVTDGTGSVAATYNYDAYGQRTSVTGSLYNPFGYAGEYTDGESGLLYLRARYYDPATQQFLSADDLPTELPYMYVNGNPLNDVDPSGYGPEVIAIAIVVAAPGAAPIILAGGVAILAAWATWQIVNYAVDQLERSGTFNQVCASRGGENNDAKVGRDAHEAFRDKVLAKPGWESQPQNLKDPKTGKKVIPDAITPSGHPVELKPNTARGRRAGRSQIKKYERATGKRGRVIYYDP